MIATDGRPYEIHLVGIGDYSPGEGIPAYSNSREGEFEWPLFTREQVQGLLDITQRSYFQPFWIEELGTYAVVVGYGNSLPAEFDVEPYMHAILRMEEIDEYRGGEGFSISFAEKHSIEADGVEVEAFSFDTVGWDFYRADDASPSAKF